MEGKSERHRSTHWDRWRRMIAPIGPLAQRQPFVTGGRSSPCGLVAIVTIGIDTRYALQLLQQRQGTQWMQQFLDRREAHHHGDSRKGRQGWGV